ncbi:MAG TPA: hypothetical protein VLE95_07885 [Chlamydiales bacterium]|nr:hypothetical protein [Chlamydiales bacterium]
MAIEIVGRCLTELGCSLLIDSGFHRFTSSPKAGGVLFGSALMQTVSNSFLRYRAYNTPPRGANGLVGRLIPLSTHALCANIFACFTGVHAQRLLHEGGHAWAANAVFKNAKPKITLFPYGATRTEYATAELTDFGSKLGKHRSLTLVAVSGPATTLLVSTIAMIAGMAVRAKFQELSCYLIAYGRMDFFQHAVYAANAMLAHPKDDKHDFVVLSASGVHPLAAAIVLIALPLFLEFGTK